MKTHNITSGVVMRGRGWLTSFQVLVATIGPASSLLAACDDCSVYGPPASWGMVTHSAITEASGLASSRRNPGVLWTHNDGSRQRVFAISTNGNLLASYNLNTEILDMEDVATGQLPSGAPVVYFGDIGASSSPVQARRELQIIRAPEPLVSLAWADAPKSGAMAGVEVIRLRYPDAGYDAEALLADPRAAHLYVATKQAGFSRLYRANMASATNHSLVDLEYVRTIIFDSVSGGDISADGTRIVLRQEQAAAEWYRCDGESITAALSRPGRSVPLPALTFEPNGEAVAYLQDRSGYLTVGEGALPNLYFVPSSCPRPPSFTMELVSKRVFEGAKVEFRGEATGFPAPVFSWRFKGAVIPGAISNILVVAQAASGSAGRYELVASNAHGAVTSAAELAVDDKPLLLITEVQSSTAPSPNVPSKDWWELTNFEGEPVDISGWRFNDASGDLADSFTIPSGVVLRPGESIIFAEDLSPEEFRAWWGTGVPDRTVVVKYSGSGLSLSAGGDSIRVWTATTTDVASVVAHVDFGAADRGVTFNFDPQSHVFGRKSQLGIDGVFRASSSTDIGSPGRITALPGPPVLDAAFDGFAVTIHFQARAGFRYRLQSMTSTHQGWVFSGDELFAGADGAAEFTDGPTSSAKLYRVLVD